MKSLDNTFKFTAKVAAIIAIGIYMTACGNVRKDSINSFDLPVGSPGLDQMLQIQGSVLGSYKANESVPLSLGIYEHGQPVSGANVQYDITRLSDGQVSQFRFVSDSNGKVDFNLPVTAQDQLSDYQVKISAVSSAGSEKSGTGITSYKVVSN